jgi:hypothetical protein
MAENIQGGFSYYKVLVLEPGMVVHTCGSSTRELRQEACKFDFEAGLG